MTPRTIRILREARWLITKRKQWITGALAIDREGCVVDPESTDACAWCASGAIIRVSGPKARGYVTAIRAVNAALRGTSLYISEYNDNRTHGSVLRLFDRAIDLAERKLRKRAK